ncbi:MAG: ABC transporter ATP-binding protein [Propionibacteriaceae bacterium]
MSLHQEVAVSRDDKITTVRERQAGSGARNGGPMGAGRVVEKPANFTAGLKRLFSHLRPERVTILLAIVLAAIGVTLNVIGPKVIGRATDVIFSGVVGKNLPAGVAKEILIAKLRAEGKGTLADMLARMDVVPGAGIDFTRLAHILLWGVAIYLVAALFILIQGQLLNGAIQRSMYRMRKEVSAKLDRLPLSYFDQQPRGELLSRVTNDIDNVSSSLQQTLTQLLTSLLTVIGVLVMMLQTSKLLTGIALISIPVSIVLVVIIGKQSQKRFAAMWKATGDLNSHIEESYSGHSLVKVFGRQKESIATFKARNDELFQHSFGAQFLSSLIMPIMFFVGNLSFVFIALVGGLRLAHGQMSLGDVQAFIQYNRMFTQPLTQVASMSNVLQSGVASAERVFAVLDANEQSPEATGDLETIHGQVVFDHVDFSYTDEPLITDLSLNVEPGQTVAIVGSTGAGKTTLVNLLMRFYEIQDGAITLDGTDIQTVPRSELRSRIGMVLQDTWLFSGTIRDNIAYGRPDATEDEIFAAARATYVDRFVHSLPEGYDTIIDEEASNISAGEKQLITIARAFLKDPALLILDEATSSVDTRTEVLVQKAMNALQTERTSFVIAHRLSTIRDADVIIVMESGHIVEQGSHDDLLAAKGAYYQLYQSQFSSAA